jgi:heme A synthase
VNPSRDLSGRDLARASSALTGYAVWWVVRARSRGALVVLALVLLQVTVAALMVTGGLPRGLQALHVAVVVDALRPE